MPLAFGWFVWGGLLGVLYLIAFITAGVMTIRNGHLVMFILGFIFQSSGSSEPSWTSLATSRGSCPDPRISAARLERLLDRDQP